MWTCKVCARSVEDDEAFCYHCGCPQALDEPNATRLKDKWLAQRVKCVRCQSVMKYAGLKTVHGGTSGWKFWLGELGDRLAHHEAYDLYVCPNCGKIEMFVDGLGEELRCDEER
jgi:hypothetical protein